MHAPPRFCITTDLPLGGLYFIDKVGETGQLECVIVQVPEAGSLWTWVLWRVISKYYYALTHLLTPGTHPYHILRRKLFGYSGRHIPDGMTLRKLGQLSAEHGFQMLFTKNFNSDVQVRRALAASQGSYMFVLGGKIIEPDLLRLFGGMWLNAHGGVLPEYRGLASEYWAIRNGDFESIGCTIHVLTQKVDSGEILRVSTIPYDPNETLQALCIRNHANLIDTYLKVVAELADSADSISSVSGRARLAAEVSGSSYYSVPKHVNLRKLARTKVKDI